MAAKYQLYKDKAGKYRFRLVAENGRTIATGEAYARRTSCVKGIESVKKNRDSSVEDTTIDSPKIPFPKYQVLLDKAGEFRFNLSASNGEVIASSEGYSSKEACLNGIDAVRRIGGSEIEDLTTVTVKKEETKETPMKEPKPVVVHEEVAPIKQPEPESPPKEEEPKMPLPTVSVTASKEITTSGDETKIKRKGVSAIAVVILVVGLVVGFILLAVGLGFGGFFGAADAYAKVVLEVVGALVICASILLFFAKK